MLERLSPYEDTAIKEETMKNTVDVEHTDTKPSLEDSEENQSNRDHIKGSSAEDKSQSDHEE